VLTIVNGLAQIKNNCSSISELTGFDYCTADTINTVDLQSVLDYTDFVGLTGRVTFNGNDRVGKRHSGNPLLCRPTI